MSPTIHLDYRDDAWPIRWRCWVVRALNAVWRQPKFVVVVYRSVSRDRYLVCIERRAPLSPVRRLEVRQR